MLWVRASLKKKDKEKNYIGEEQRELSLHTQLVEQL